MLWIGLDWRQVERLGGGAGACLYGSPYFLDQRWNLIDFFYWKFRGGLLVTAFELCCKCFAGDYSSFTVCPVKLNGLGPRWRFGALQD